MPWSSKLENDVIAIGSALIVIVKCSGVSHKYVIFRRVFEAALNQIGFFEFSARDSMKSHPTGRARNFKERRGISVALPLEIPDAREFIADSLDKFSSWKHTLTTRKHASPVRRETVGI
ncbi:uncharacterized protein LOC111673986 [Orussus abietinus]|uniref:uncharacterized protein LOC111673986 n=1 Tax=Orussus abietinus TaxID=222816 RepID=UPI000C715FB4|nr:uncharacterized protein LOC111673986 [Orussus abietinus]